MNNNTTEIFESRESSVLLSTSIFSDNSSSQNDEGGELPATFKIANLIVRLLLGALSVFGNSLTILAISKYHYLRTNTNYLIGGLAAADLLGSILPILMIAYHIVENHFETWVVLCIIEQFLSNLSSALNVITIMWISFDRFLYIILPLRYDMLLKAWHVSCILCISWIFILVQLICMTSLGHGLKQGLACRSITVWPYPIRAVISNVQFVIYSAITLCIYLGIAIIADKQKRAINQQMGPLQQANAKRENKITKMMAMVLGIYFACYLPQIIVIAAIGTYSNPPLWIFILERITAWIWWVNSFVNPMIYAWKSKDFARAFRHILGMEIPEVFPSANGIPITSE